jgi:hypothetical protein
VRVATWRWPLAAALLFASVGSGLTEARAQTDNPLPSAPPEVQEKTPRATKPDEPPTAAPDTGSPLSEELERSEGVIVPVDPGVDRDMVQPPPDTGGTATMPVIPPSGTPGGDPNARPK